MERESIGTNKPNIDEFFTSRQYIIPKFQRPFSWDVNNADRFWDDVFSNSDKGYFFGSVVLSKIDEGSYEVIDGQQRITTLSLFFLALYLFYKDRVDAGDAKDIFKYLKAGNLASGNYQILRLSKVNSEYYDALLNTNTLSELETLSIEGETNKNILAVLKFFVSKLKDGSSTDVNMEKIRLVEIYRKVINEVFFMEIVVSGYKYASKLFEVLNDRGVDLAEGDLIRNYLLSEAERQGFSSVDESWMESESIVGLDNLDKFLRYSTILVSLKSGLYDRVIDYTERNSSKTTVDYLCRIAPYYRRMLDPDSFSENDEENKGLNELKILGSTQLHSVLMAAYLKFNPEDIKKLIRLLVNFTFRYSTICGKNPNKLEKEYANIAYAVYSSGKPYESVRSDIIALDPSEQEFRKSFIEKSFKNAKIARYIIGKIENFVSSEEKIVDFSAVHLEHIMPKNIEKWKANGFNQKIHIELLNNIGNMVLLSKTINTRIKNSVFIDKKKEYDSSQINLIGEILTKVSWGSEEIRWNQSRYADISKQVWKVE